MSELGVIQLLTGQNNSFNTQCTKLYPILFNWQHHSPALNSTCVFVCSVWDTRNNSIFVSSKCCEECSRKWWRCEFFKL